MNLKSMPVAKLLHLKGQVETALRTKVADRRRTLESDLARLTRFGANSKRGRMGKIPAKYRNPDNPSETWAGRGLKPRWLAAALKSGKKLEHFAIAAPARAAAAKKTPTKTRRARKAQKK
jgi:DNA-binding protein H-NS